MNNNFKVNMASKNSLGEKYYNDKTLTFGEHRAEMLKLELLYRKIMKKYEV